MPERRAFWRMTGLSLITLFAVISLAGAVRSAWASGPWTGEQPATPQPWEWSPPLGADGQPLAVSLGIDLPDPAPVRPAETFTSRPFWIVLGLVVLGSIVLMADFPDTN